MCPLGCHHDPALCNHASQLERVLVEQENVSISADFDPPLALELEKRSGVAGDQWQYLFLHIWTDVL